MTDVYEQIGKAEAIFAFSPKDPRKHKEAPMVEFKNEDDLLLDTTNF
jgi:hypothetical protein